MVYAPDVAADETSEDPRAGDDAATAHDGEVGDDAGADGEVAPTSDAGEPTTRDLLLSVEKGVGDMVTAIDTGTTGDVDMDALLDRAHETLTSLLAGPKCPMCDGVGILAIEPPPDPRAERCDDCNGRGTVYTGSLVPESAVRPCGKCGGKGFNDKATVTTLPTTDYSTPPPPAGAQWYDANDPGTWHLPLDPAVRGVNVTQSL